MRIETRQGYIRQLYSQFKDEMYENIITHNNVIHAEMKPQMFRLIKACRAMALGKSLVSKRNAPVEITLMILTKMLTFDHVKPDELRCILNFLLNRRTIGRVVYEECSLMFTFPA